MNRVNFLQFCRSIICKLQFSPERIQAWNSVNSSDDLWQRSANWAGKFLPLSSSFCQSESPRYRRVEHCLCGMNFREPVILSKISSCSGNSSPAVEGTCKLKIFIPMDRRDIRISELDRQQRRESRIFRKDQT